MQGNQQLEDILEWCYRCPFSLEYMGDTANLAGINIRGKKWMSTRLPVSLEL